MTRRAGVWIAAAAVCAALGTLLLAGKTARPEAAGADVRPRRDATRVAPPSSPASVPVDGGVRLDCAHPLVPSAVGALRRYRILGGSPTEPGELSISLEHLRADGAELVSMWRIVVHAEGREPAGTRIETRCEPGVASEDPWSALVPALTSLSVEGRWRWPVVLEPGTTFGGTARLRVQSDPQTWLTIERRHRVEQRETTAVPAGTFDAWRVDVSEETRDAEGAETVRGTLWVAEGVGLVRSVTGAGRDQQVMELAEHER